ncbi:uncharacterized protein LOC133171638 [Saccostrea echinata]|uniref:uncharacterized protein LOC133171638 n=1 Tax=Saccostrea echinata TaxID=191078 RepID=UPI002A7F336E|nr:uncharacterized protein LOC133171638 [Saccostrea echinata]
MILKLTLLTLLLVSTAAAGSLWKCARTGGTQGFTDATRCIWCTCTENGYFDCRNLCEARFPFAKVPVSNLAKILRRRYDTPPPLTTTTKGTTNSPPPYTTQTPPHPGTTKGPTTPTTTKVNHHTRSPPPPKSVVG